MQKKWTEALADYDAVLAIAPRDLQTLLSRAGTHYVAGDYEKAGAAYADTIEKNPNAAQPYNDYAWLLATAPKDGVRDGAKAVELAKKACDLTEFKNPGYVDTLAAAHAEKGEFDDAVKWQKEAVSLAGQEPEELQAELKSRIDLYTGKKPYREEPK
jgi:serine/threonine-protein kinase